MLFNHENKCLSSRVIVNKNIVGVARARAIWMYCTLRENTKAHLFRKDFLAASVLYWC